MTSSSFCLISHAVSHLTSIWRDNSSAAMSFFADVIRGMARNHLVSGVRDLWKIVPARTEVWTRQARHWNSLRGLQSAWTRRRHFGHTKPSGQRSFTSASWQLLGAIALMELRQAEPALELHLVARHRRLPKSPRNPVISGLHGNIAEILG